ncbi:hypothetical protein FRC11_012102 [Ceratobasidium sp. 423]|nr:hypothetical protein FRC11_012102 [Ceratobasidium sp. 423]
MGQYSCVKVRYIPLTIIAPWTTTEHISATSPCLYDVVASTSALTALPAIRCKLLKARRELGRGNTHLGQTANTRPAPSPSEKTPSATPGQSSAVRTSHHDPHRSTPTPEGGHPLDHASSDVEVIEEPSPGGEGSGEGPDTVSLPGDHVWFDECIPDANAANGQPNVNVEVGGERDYVPVEHPPPPEPFDSAGDVQQHPDRSARGVI